MPRFLHTEKRRVNTAAVVKKLARQVNAKLAELNKLQADHSELLHNQALLTTVCEHLAWIRAQKVAAACDGVEQAIDEAELELLQQLGAAPAASGESNSSSMSSSSVLSLGPREDSSSAADGTTISPASDPLQLLRCARGSCDTAAGSAAPRRAAHAAQRSHPRPPLLPASLPAAGT